MRESSTSAANPFKYLRDGAPLAMSHTEETTSAQSVRGVRLQEHFRRMFIHVRVQFFNPDFDRFSGTNTSKGQISSTGFEVLMDLNTQKKQGN